MTVTDPEESNTPTPAPAPPPGPPATPYGGAPSGVTAPEGEVLRELRLLRASIDNLDAALVHLLAERFKCTQKVGELKAAHHLPPADPNREAEQIRRLRRLAEDAELEPQFAEKFLNFIVEEVVQHHKLIAAAAAADRG